jgi:hypothetical protein
MLILISTFMGVRHVQKFCYGCVDVGNSFELNAKQPLHEKHYNYSDQSIISPPHRAQY